MAYKSDRLVSIYARSNVTIDIDLHVVGVRAGVRYVITKFSCIHRFQIFRSARRVSTNNNDDDSDNNNNDDNERDVCPWAIVV